MGRTRREGDIRYWESESLDEHVALIKRQVDRSLDDPEIGPLVERIVANDVGPRQQLHAWGSVFRVPRDGQPTPQSALERSQLAVTRIWNFVSLNWSYIEDPPGFDLFAHIKYGMNAREHAKNLRSLAVEDPETQQMVDEHIERLLAVTTPGAGDCDDATVVFGALFKAAGFKAVRARVVSVDARDWGHVYAMVGVPKDVPAQLVALDPTVKGATPGWEYPSSKVLVDFEL